MLNFNQRFKTTNTMKHIHLLALLLLSNLGFSQIVILQSGTTASQFSTLDAAIDAASNGDFIYLSGGNFLKNPTPINKELHFIGAGIHTDSTAVTTATSISVVGSDFHIGTDADNSTFDGINFTQLVIFTDESGGPCDADNVVFSRCKFNGIDARGSNTLVTLSNIILQECIVNGYASDLGKDGTTCLIDRCYVYVLTSAGPQSCAGITVLNSIVLDETTVGSSYTNCIFRYSYGGECFFTNCITSDDDFGSLAVFTNSTTGVLWVDIFINPTDAFGYLNFTQDFHIITGSVADNAGSDGTDAGIYGTSNPTKEGFVPYNPHFRMSDIPNATDSNGILNVQAQVAAQEN
jgi:hypothetical protein